MDGGIRPADSRDGGYGVGWSRRKVMVKVFMLGVR